MSGSAEPAIAAEHVTKRFGDETSVDDVSFSVPTATIFGFIGPSGSGKTSMVRLLTGVHRPSAGSVSVLGLDPAAFAADQRTLLGYLPQRPVLYPQLSVAANVRFAAALYGVGWRRRGEIDEVLDFVELLPHRRKRLAATSGGMQRRAALAAALVHDPVLLFLDEPTAGLDPILRHKLWDHFRKLRGEGRTLFVTTQHVDEAAHCDRVGVMSRGRLLTADEPAALRRRAMGGDVVRVRTHAPLTREERLAILSLEVVSEVRPVPEQPTLLDLVVDDAASATPVVVDHFRGGDENLLSIEAHVASFDEVFVRLIAAAATRTA